MWAGVQLFVAFLILAPFYSTITESLYGRWLPWLKEFVTYGAAPYWGVTVGSSVAPRHRFKVALALGVLGLGAQLLVGTLPLLSRNPGPGLVIVGNLVTVAAIVLAVVHVRRDERRGHSG